MKTEYNGIEIAYNEKTNEWECVIRDRHRVFLSLAKAKEAIDTHPKTKAGMVEKFEPVAVLKLGYHRAFEVGKITSYAEPRYGKNVTEAWVSFGGQRAKESLSSLYFDTPENRAALEESHRLEEESKQLQKQAREMRWAKRIPDIAP